MAGAERKRGNRQAFPHSQKGRCTLLGKEPRPRVSLLAPTLDCLQQLLCAVEPVGTAEERASQGILVEDIAFPPGPQGRRDALGLVAGVVQLRKLDGSPENSEGASHAPERHPKLVNRFRRIGLAQGGPVRHEVAQRVGDHRRKQIVERYFC